MAKFFGRKEPVRAQAGDRLVTCLHCGHDHFWPRQVKLNSGMSELLDLGWADQDSTALICAQCGFMMEFLPDFLALERR